MRVVLLVTWYTEQVIYFAWVILLIDSCDTKFTGTSDFIKYARNSIFPLPPSIGERIRLRHEKPFNNALSITLATAIW